MGGDDLGSDDEFLAAPIRDEEEEVSKPSKDLSGQKRSESPAEHQPILQEEPEARPSKKRRTADKDNGLRKLGTDIRAASSEVQAKWLSQLADTPFRKHQMAKSDSSDASAMVKRIQGIVSKKKLKNWKNKESSPCAIIVCLSARRAVEVLKELAPLQTRAVKLFAKHMTVEEQTKQLESSTFGLAVGTPHRILTLAQRGALSLDETQFVILDTFLNPKNFSVYTLPDTVPHTQELLQKYVHPQCKRRRDLRVAFA